MTPTKGLPTALDAERMVLGSIFLAPDLWIQAAKLETNDFSIEKHRRIFKRMGDVHERGETIDRGSVYYELAKHDEAESCDGLAYLADLDHDVPQIPNIESYVRIVKDAAALRAIIFAAQHMQNRAMSGNQTPDEILAGAKETLLSLSEGRQESTLVSPGSIIEEGGGLTAYLDRRNRTEGLKTGFSQFDTMTGGFKPGALYVLGARPSMGKTAWVLNVTENISVKGDAVTLVFSLEMDRQSLLDRLICARGRINTKKFECGHLSADEMGRAFKAAGQIDCDRILIDDKATTDMGEIHAKIRKEQARRPVGLVVIDYLQLMIGGDLKFRVAETSKISRDMKLVAKDCKVPLLALSQLNRECDTRTDHRPVLSDLRESGSIEQDADLVSFLYRPEVYDKDREDLRAVAELIVAKQRSGPIGTVDLIWLKEMVRFEERAYD